VVLAAEIVGVLLTWLGVFDAGFWDVTVEYAKNTPCDLLCRYTVCNQSSRPASIHVLPTLWFRSDHIQCLSAVLTACNCCTVCASEKQSVYIHNCNNFYRLTLSLQRRMQAIYAANFFL